MPAMKQAKLDAKVWREFLPFIWHFTTHIHLMGITKFALKILPAKFTQSPLQN